MALAVSCSIKATVMDLVSISGQILTIDAVLSYNNKQHASFDRSLHLCHCGDCRLDRPPSPEGGGAGETSNR